MKVKQTLFLIGFLLLAIKPVLAGPQSTTYELKEYGVNSGGTEGSNSTSYSLFGVAGEPDTGKIQSTTYQANNGLIYTIIANVPPAPALTNPSSYYNKLKLVLATGGNPTDTQFAIAISTDNFATDTKYVQSDNTVGAVLGPEDWQTYATWGGASGFNIIGLASSTTYTVKVAAKQGNFTQSPWGPTAQAATVGAQFSLSVSPNSINLGNLTPGTVITSGTAVSVTVSTNGVLGASIYVAGLNTGLLSPRVSYTISSSSNNLTSIAEGYGLRGTTVSQTSGGPMEIIAPYNGAGNNVGVADPNKRLIFDSTNAPVTTGVGSFEIKAKAGSTAPASPDYVDTLTIVASGAF